MRLTANEVRCKSLQEFKSPRLRSFSLGHAIIKLVLNHLKDPKILLPIFSSKFARSTTEIREIFQQPLSLAREELGSIIP